jgi:hypothetical protein
MRKNARKCTNSAVEENQCENRFFRNTLQLTMYCICQPWPSEVASSTAKGQPRMGAAAETTVQRVSAAYKCSDTMVGVPMTEIVHGIQKWIQIENRRSYW